MRRTYTDANLHLFTSDHPSLWNVFLDSHHGVIICNHFGKLIHIYAYNLGPLLVYNTEATTLRCGILLSLKLVTEVILIEGDNLLILNTINNIWSPQCQTAHVIQDILLLLANFKTQHIFGKQTKQLIG